MSTKILTNDLRKSTIPTFEDVKIGDMFTDLNGEVILIKIRPIEDDTYNAIALDSNLYWYDSKDEIEYIKEISITIK